MTKTDKAISAAGKNAKIMDETSETFRLLNEASELAVPGKGDRIDHLSDEEILLQLGSVNSRVDREAGSGRLFRF